MRPRPNVAFLTALALASTLSACQRQVREGEYDFDAAIDNGSTTYPIVRIKLAGETPDQETCVTAGALVQAIQIENGLPQDIRGTERARQIAKSKKHQPFTFQNKEALAALKVQWLDERQAAIACQAIKAGHAAEIGDNAPYLYVGDGKGGWTKAD